jgi:hypothetical protein
MENNTAANTLSQDFDTSLALFIADSQEKISVHYKKNLPNLDIPKLEVMNGTKNVRVVLKDVVSRSAWCFVEKSTGNVLKAASWAAPAKHARGSIYSPQSWATVTSYGPQYLR